MVILKKYYKTDFDLIILPHGNNGFPDYDFKMVFFTTGETSYAVERYGNRYSGVVNQSGKIKAIFKNHGLKPGVLWCEFHAYVPDSEYPGNIKEVITKFPTFITLTKEETTGTDEEELANIFSIYTVDLYESMVALGYKGSKDDLYKGFIDLPSVIAESKQTIHENQVVTIESRQIVLEGNSMIQKISELDDRVRVDEAKRADAESERVLQENERDAAESQRVANEEDRIKNESSRSQSENARISNEEARASSENARNSSEIIRQNNENLRIDNEAQRQEAESKRQSLYDQSNALYSVLENMQLYLDKETGKLYWKFIK